MTMPGNTGHPDPANDTGHNDETVHRDEAGRTGRSAPWWLDRDEGHRPPAARGPGSRRDFGRTWWGRAWIDALEHKAELDPGRLARGRSYARRGAVVRMDVAPGLVMASVQGSRLAPYTVTVVVPTFGERGWDSVLDAIAAQIGRTAALLDGELPPDVVQDVASAGLDLLPGAGEVRPSCSCPDFAVPCKHAAAVCYQVADQLDDDPFALLLLRGRPRADVLRALRARRTSDVGEAPTSPDVAHTGDVAEGMTTRELLALARVEGRPAVPVPPRPPERPGHPATTMLDPPPAAGIDPDALRAVAAGAVERAWRLATGDVDQG
jgi:uncharacterized Zn finger protein